MADVNEDPDNSSPTVSSSADNLTAGPGSPNPLVIRIPNQKAIAIKEWEIQNNTNISDLCLKMKSTFEDLQRKKIFSAYERKGYNIPENFPNKFKSIIRNYIYEEKNLNKNSPQSMADDWNYTANSLFSISRRLRLMREKKRTLIDAALKKAGHPVIDGEIIEALLFAVGYARQKREEWLSKRVRGPEAISYLIELLANGLESSMKRRLPRTLEIHRDDIGHESFHSPFAELLWELTKCVKPNTRARRVRSVLERLSRE